MTRSARTRPDQQATRGVAARRDWLVLAAILLGGLLLRAGYLVELERTPDFAAPLADAAFHHYWAKGLATGDWTLPPNTPDPEIRTTPFLRPPGYPYFLALIYWITGPNFLAARVAQMALGLASCVLAWRLGAGLFGRAAGLIAAAFLAAHWAFIYYEGELQEPFLLVLLVLALTLLWQRWAAHPRAWLSGAAGLVMGLAALVRSNMLLLAPVALAWLVWVLWRRGQVRQAWTAAVALLVGTAAAIAPATIRNYVVAGEPVLIASNGAINFYIGNNERSDGVTARAPVLARLMGDHGWSWFAYPRIARAVAAELGRPLRYSEVSAFFSRKAGEFIRARPLRCVQLAAYRAALLLGPVEVTNNKVVHYDRRHSRLLRWLPGFPFALATALLGGALLWREGRPARPKKDQKGSEQAGRRETLVLVVLSLLSYFASFLPFFAAERFRVPLVPLLALFGAYGLYRLGDWARRGDWRRAAVWGVAGLGLFGLAQVRWAPYEPKLGEWHMDRGAAFEGRGDSAAALAEYRAAVRGLPTYIDARMALIRVLEEQGRTDEVIAECRATLALVPQLADVHYVLGRALTQRGELDAAQTAYRTALRHNPRLTEAHVNLGGLLLDMRRWDEALAEFRAALRIQPEHVAAHYNMGNALAAMGDLDGAIGAYEATLRINPNLTEACVNLGSVLLQKGRTEEAVAICRRAIGLDPRRFEAWYNLASALAARNQIDEAIAAFTEALKLRPDNQDARRAIETLTATRPAP